MYYDEKFFAKVELPENPDGILAQVAAYFDKQEGVENDEITR